MPLNHNSLLKPLNTQRIWLRVAILCLLALSPFLATASAPVEKKFTSPNGVLEICRALARMPSAEYKDKDAKTEASFCRYDLYSGDTAMCPKTWSTSPGTIFYSMADGEFSGRAADFENQWCSKIKGHHSVPAERVAKFKSTMNSTYSSATFSTASLLYYHFSRYFDTAIKIPAVVWRSIDRREHMQRVSKKGVALSTHSKMIHAGWLKMEMALEDHSTYHPEDELFTLDREAIYGIMIDSHGSRYGVEINGTRESGWGVGQNLDFLKTPAYLALSSNLPLVDAISHGQKLAGNSAKQHKAMGKGFSDLQMLYWMQELTEITLLDFIFNQQDRIGNIDYRWYWYWQDAGKVQHRRAESKTAPEDIVGFKPVRIKRTHLNDNDAGGKATYVNFTRKAKMLEKQRHYNAATYQKLQQLSTDFDAQGRLYQYLKNTFGLSQRQMNSIVKNTHDAATLLRQSCLAGRLTFDLEPEEFMLSGGVVTKKVACE